MPPHRFRGLPMAGRWSKDGAIHEQIDASIKDAVDRARGQLP